MHEHFKEYLSHHVTRTYDRGSTILFQGEAPRAACVVDSGIVRAINISAQGEEQTINFCTAGEFFPTPWVFDKTTTSVYFYEAVTEAKICFVPRSELLKSFDKTSDARRLLVDYLATNYSAALIRISALGQPKAREKIMLTLYFLCQRYGETQGKQTCILLELTHQHIASLVGLTRETTATELNKLKRTGIVEYKNQKYAIDVPQLLKLIGEDSFRDIRIHS